MTDADLWGTWRIWMTIAAVLVVVAASLLITIIVTARRILGEAVRALRAAEQIQANTSAIWQLQETNQVAAGIVRSVERIGKRSAALAGALQGTTVGGRHAQ